MPRKIGHNPRDQKGFAVIETLVALVVIALAAVAVPAVTISMKRTLILKKREFALLMVRNNFISILTRPDIWHSTLTFGGNTAGTMFGCAPNCDTFTSSNKNTAQFAFQLYPAGAGNYIYNPNLNSCPAGTTTFNGFTDNGTPCCSTSAMPNINCPIQVTYNWWEICLTTSCNPALINLQLNFAAFYGDIGNVGIGSSSLLGSKYEIDLVRPLK